MTAEERADPPNRLWITQVDLTHPSVRVRVVPAGPDPDGPGPWQTALMPTSAVAERERFEVAVNASFFSVDKTGPWATARGYQVNQPAAAIGLTATDGTRWSPPHKDWPALWVDATGRAYVTSNDAVGPSAAQVVAGNAWILRDGEDRSPAEGMMSKRHPRTAVGVNRDGTVLTLLTVDGRRAGVSVGMTGAEMAAELKRLGVWSAINLDGGGSTTLVRRDPADGAFDLVNNPSDGKERPVANVVGVEVKGR
jgi:exopolysaccharide biosynthesis protein